MNATGRRQGSPYVTVPKIPRIGDVLVIPAGTLYTDQYFGREFLSTERLEVVVADIPKRGEVDWRHPVSQRKCSVQWRRHFA